MAPARTTPEPHAPDGEFAPSLADHACLAIVGERPTHGWAIVKLLAPGAELGRIWSLSRPLTYRAIDRLVDARFVERSDDGRRALLTPTTAGAAARRAWLDRPVDHPRELRTEFLLKLALRDRAGLPLAPLARIQLDRLGPALDALMGDAADDPVTRWRRESALAAHRFLAALAAAARSAP